MGRSGRGTGRLGRAQAGGLVRLRWGPCLEEQSHTQVSCRCSRTQFQGQAGWLRPPAPPRPPGGGLGWRGPGRSHNLLPGPAQSPRARLHPGPWSTCAPAWGRRSEWLGAFRMGVGQSGEAGTHGLASPHARGAHVTQVNGNGLLQRKHLKKKCRLQGLTSHSAPLLLPMGGAAVARAFVYPGRGVLPGGCRFWGGWCWGLFWLQVFPRPRRSDHS